MLRHRTATLDRGCGWRQTPQYRARSVQRQPKRRSEAEQINQIQPPFFGRLSYWGWWLGERATAKLTRGGGLFLWANKWFWFPDWFCPWKQDSKAPTTAGSDRVKTGNADNKKGAAIFLGCSFFWWQVVCGAEGGTTDRNSPAEQRKRPEGDRFIPLLFIYWLFIDFGLFI